MAWLGYVLGVLAAVSNAGASVMQRMANLDEESAQFSWQLVKDLLHKPVWFGGIACMTLSFFLQSAGLGLATLAAVEPLLVLELPLTLIASRLWLGARLDRRAQLSIAGMTLGTIGLIAFLGPSSGHSTGVSWWHYLVAVLATAAAVAACYVYGYTARDHRRRAAVLGVGTGVAYGLAAALLKGMTTQFAAGGISGVLTSWQLYAAIATGVLAVWMQQNAVGSERLVVAQPGITLSDPYTSIVWGAAVFHESMRGGWWIAAAAVAGAVMTASSVALTRTDTVAKEEPQQVAPGIAQEQLT